MIEPIPGEHILLSASIESVNRVDGKVTSVTLYVDGIGRVTLNPSQLRNALPTP